MIHPRLLRRTALAAAVGLTGALLPVVLTTTPAKAADGPCLSEKATGSSPLLGGGTRCDDVSQPNTTITSVTPTPTTGGYVSSPNISIDFSGAYADAYTDPISFECRFTDPTQAAPAWSTCFSPFVKRDLADSRAGAYTFEVRAVDSNDIDIDATSRPGTALNPGTPATSDVPDLDETPASVSFRVDTTAPSVYILNVPFDKNNPDMPMVYTQSPSFRLAASEPAVSIACDIDGTSYPCASGLSTFPDLPPGDHRLTIAGTDAAGNTSVAPDSVQFAVPMNITATKAQGWTTFRRPSYVGGDYLTTSTKGAKLTIPASNYQEVRVLCSTGPKYGTVEVRIPNSKPIIVNLARKKITRNDQIVLKEPYSLLRTGAITIKVVSSGKPVAIDGLLAH